MEQKNYSKSSLQESDAKPSKLHTGEKLPVEPSANDMIADEGLKNLSDVPDQSKANTGTAQSTQDKRVSSETSHTVECTDEEEIAEIVTGVFKKEPELLQRVMEDEELRELVMVQQMTYRGPLPPSQLLSEYEKFCKGSTDRFITLLEDNQKHQHLMETTAASAVIGRDKENRSHASRLTLSALGSSVVLGLFGHDWLAGAIATTTIGTILVTFILNKRPGEQGKGKSNSKPDKPSPPDTELDKEQ